MIIVSFNGEYKYNAQTSRWKYVNGSLFSLFVPLDISLDALINILYEKLGLHRTHQMLCVKVLFSHAGLEEMPPIDIQDDWTLSGWIREAKSKSNITFCVYAKPLERNDQPNIDLNQEYNVLNDDTEGDDGHDIYYDANTYANTIYTNEGEN